MNKTLLTLAIGLLLAAGSTPTRAEPTTRVAQGGVARWAAMDAASCGFLGKRYPAVDGDCYYPADMRLKPGVHEIALYDSNGKQHLGSLTVEAVEFPQIDITLPDDTYITLDDTARARHADERQRVLALFRQPYGDPQFSLPLRTPVATLPESENDFGSRRTFNGERTSQHTGRDAPVAAGTTLGALADGTVVLAEEQFFTGKAVYVDHGGGLISMFFHLSEIAVEAGDTVAAGDPIGKVGSTGRSTGPHLHVGVRWIGARIDPYLLFESPEKLPAIADSAAKADAKIDAARTAEPAEHGSE